MKVSQEQSADKKGRHPTESSAPQQLASILIVLPCNRFLVHKSFLPRGRIPPSLCVLLLPFHIANIESVIPVLETSVIRPAIAEQKQICLVVGQKKKASACAVWLMISLALDAHLRTEEKGHRFDIVALEQRLFVQSVVSGVTITSILAQRLVAVGAKR
jgi:hypothetical protein